MDTKKSPEKDQNQLLTNFFVHSKKVSPKKEEKEPEEYDYGDVVSSSKAETVTGNANGAAIGKQYFSKGPEFYRFPMVLEC